ncbi:unnamed protein product [Mytilus coruscus]|uniref:Uncharacterized protein n=1 Tax=Mytilus coruscus TaxID=42192 RepID=A0A6J8C6E3_MYTCO|nr:unnamed protein product [Mytilus coruscus]
MIEEQLFVTEPDFLKTCNDSHAPIVPVDNNANIPNLGTFCACEQQHDRSLSPNGHCNLTQINEQCSESQSSSSAYVHYTRCPQSQRRRRAVDSSNKQILSDNDDFVDFHPLTYSNDVNDTHTEILQNDVLYTSGEDIVLATYRNSFMITLDIPAARKKRSTDNAVLSDGYDISLSYDGQNFGEEIRIIIYDDLQYSCNATTQTCITLIVDESSEKNETTKDTKDVMMIVIPITVSVVVIVVIAGVVCFKLKAKFSRKKIAAYKDEPDHKVTPSNNWKGQHSTSTIDFQFAEDTGVDSVAEQYPTQKENVDI